MDIPNDRLKKSYLGDGVYAREEFGMMVLTTENGISVQNEIAFEPEVIEAMFRYLERSRGLKIEVSRREHSDTMPGWNVKE